MPFLPLPLLLLVVLVLERVYFVEARVIIPRVVCVSVPRHCGRE